MLLKFGGKHESFGELKVYLYILQCVLKIDINLIQSLDIMMCVQR